MISLKRDFPCRRAHDIHARDSFSRLPVKSAAKRSFDRLQLQLSQRYGKPSWPCREKKRERERRVLVTGKCGDSMPHNHRRVDVHDISTAMWINKILSTKDTNMSCAKLLYIFCLFYEQFYIHYFMTRKKYLFVCVEKDILM